MTTDLQFIDLQTEATDDLITAIYHNLLEPAFPSDELDSLETLIDALAGRGDETWGLCALDGHNPVACILAYPYRASGVLLIGYLAVDSGLRGHGLGGKILAEAERRWLGQSDMTLILGEVEDPRHYRAKGDIDPERRATFYTKLGVQVIVGPYFQPRLSPTKPRVHNLLLSVLGSTDTTKDSVSGKQISEFLAAYFRSSGESRNWPLPGDTEGNNLIAWYRANERIRLQPIGDYESIQIPSVLLSYDEWSRIKAEYLSRDIGTLRQQLINNNIITELPESAAIEDNSDDDHDHLTKELSEPDPWTKSMQVYNGSSILAFFVFAWGMAIWELTGEHERVRKYVAEAINGYQMAISGCAHQISVNRALLDFILLGLCGNADKTPKSTQPNAGVSIPAAMWESHGLLFDAMSVEASIYSGSAAAAAMQANEVRSNSAKLIKRLDEITDPDTPPELIELLHNILDDHITYYSTIADIAAALQSAAIKESNADQLLTEAISKSTSAQDKLTNSGDVLASELSAYHLVLQGWRRRLIIAPTEVELTSAQVTYIYPFALPDIEGEDAQRTVLKLDQSSHQPAPKVLEFTGAPRLDDLSDLWTWGGRGKCLQKSISLPLPDVTLHTPGEVDSQCSYSAAAHFSALGNHYLRLTTELDNATLNQLNQAMRRATAYAGQQHIMSAGRPTKTWNSVADYAQEVIDYLGNWIIDDIRTTMPGYHGLRTTTAENPTRFEADLDYHVIVKIRRATVHEGNGTSRRAKKREILRAFGSVLSQPLNREVTALDEWICWSHADTKLNLLGDIHLSDDFAIGTEHSTTLCMPSTPDWSHCGYEEVAEFSASLPTLIRSWQADFDTRVRVAQDLLDAANKIEDPHGNATELDAIQRNLDAVRTHLRDMTSKIRNQQFYLIPSRLVSLSAERSFLANLYAINGIHHTTEDITKYLERGDIAVERITTREDALREQRTKVFEERMQWTLFFVSLFSFSSVLALALQLLYGADIPGVPYFSKDIGHGEFDLGIGVLVYGTLCFGLFIYLKLSRNKLLKARIPDRLRTIRPITRPPKP